MRILLSTFLIAFPLLISACSSPYAGAYRADVRVMKGREPTNEPGYTLEEVRARVREENRTLHLKKNGRFVWNTGDAVNEGTWRVEGNTLYLLEDTYDGTPIQSALQREREWTINAAGEIVRGGYTQYNLEEFFYR